MDQIENELADADPFKSWWPFIIAGFVGFAVMIRNFMSGMICPNSNKIDGQTVIITGSSGGIGLEICKELCHRGAIVIMAVRDTEKAEKAIIALKKLIPTAKIQVQYLDLQSFDCVRSFVKSIENDFERIDILINNAGVTFYPYEKTCDGFETHLQVNYLGHFLLTTLLIPKLLKSKQGRIINTSAHAYCAAKFDINDPLNIGTFAPSYHARDAFAHSKAAIVLSTKYLAKLLKDTPITVNVYTPGLVRGTDHLRRSMVMKAICAKAVTYPWMWLLMKTPTQGSQTGIYLASNTELNSVSGVYFNDCQKTETAEFTNDEKLGLKLFQETLRALRLDKFL